MTENIFNSISGMTMKTAQKDGIPFMSKKPVAVFAAGFSLGCARHGRQLGGESPLHTWQ